MKVMGMLLVLCGKLSIEKISDLSHLTIACKNRSLVRELVETKETGFFAVSARCNAPLSEKPGF